MIVCCEGQTRHCYSRSLVESFLKKQPSPPPEGGEEDEDDDHIETHTLPSTLLEGKCQPIVSLPFNDGYKKVIKFFCSTAVEFYFYHNFSLKLLIIIFCRWTFPLML